MKIVVASRKLGVDRVGEKSLTAFRSRSSVRTTRFSDKNITVTFVWQTEISGRHLRGFGYASIVLLSETPSRYANYRGRALLYAKSRHDPFRPAPGTTARL